MNNVRWIFFLTENGRAPTAASEKLLLDTILGSEEKNTTVRTFGGPDWMNADRLAYNLKHSSIVAVLTKDKDGTYSCNAIQGKDNIDKLCALLHAKYPVKNSYELAKLFITENQR